MDVKTKKVELNSTGIAWLVCILVLPTVGYWHAWRWYIHRVAHSLEEAVGLLLFTAVLVCVCAKSIIENRAYNQLPLTPLTILFLVYSLSYLFPVAAIFQMAIALLATLYIVYRLAFSNRPPVSFWAVVLIALPVVPSLQFYLGFPVRYVSAYLTVIMLRLNGIPVSQDGINLLWNGQVLQFDAPCSGVTMLWAGMLFSLSLSLVYGFRLVKTLLAVVIAFIFVLAGNVVRASSLFYLEVGAVSFDGEWLHEAIGSTSYLLVMVCIAACLSYYQRRGQVS